ncbi:hypothetical protein [Streptomyces formicae]|uniref:HTTM domain-containing protein n=1 Tax=Streptomyces formicae TaxID=1616117 RepID=A0ABY3WVQ8_9ACTN|nr:hypothetical protein [Streptomyces formicae]UNM15626.1 hypothetical protein J4032_32930 [Streptomyces formicae]
MSGRILVLQRPWRDGLGSRLGMWLTTSRRLLDLCVIGRILTGGALLLISWFFPESVVGLLLVNFLFLSFFLFRCGYGLDGADQMLIIVCVSTLLALTDSPLLRSAGLWFMTAQLVLSFMVAGIAKLCGEDWRSGRALTGIMTTDRYGLPGIGRVLIRRPVLSRALGWGVIAFESSFFLILLGYRPIIFAYLGAGLLFHAGVAFSMGLNNFLFSFAPAYPLVALCLL